MARSNQHSRNEQRIREGFTKLSNVHDAVFREGLTKAGQALMEEAIQDHDEFHSFHVEIGNTYGWAVSRDGSLLGHGSNTGGPTHYPGQAEEAVVEKSKEAPGGTWRLVVLADMENAPIDEDGRAHGFSEPYESRILEDILFGFMTEWKTFIKAGRW